MTGGNFQAWIPMSKKLLFSIRKTPSAFVCLAIAFLLISSLWWGGFFTSFDTALYDFFLRLRVRSSPQPLNSQVVPVDLNDKTEMTLGERLDDRTAFGELFSVIAYCRGKVALDFIFQGNRENDLRMLEGAEMVNSLFTAVVPVPEGRENISYRSLTQDEKTLLKNHIWRPKEFGAGAIPRAGAFIMPFMEFGQLAAQLAHIGVEPDPDGVYRRVPLFYAWEDGFIPSISLAAAVSELGIDPQEIEIHYGKEVLLPFGDEKISIPIDIFGNVAVPFQGRWEDTVFRRSFDDLANALHDDDLLNEIRGDFSRSLFFVADTTFSKKDIGPIPIESYYPLGGLHTWVISGILDAAAGEDSFYRETSGQYRLVCFMLFASVFFVLGIMRKDWIFNTGAAFLFFGFTGLTLYMWFFKQIIPWYGIGAFFLFFAWLLGFSYRFISQRRKQSALERYVPRPVAQKLITGQRLNLVPIYKELTILFSDISGFTKWSADKQAQDVHSFLNEYLESMADILFAHGATIDKFMGDGILAFFGDPLDISNHAEESVKSALAMQEKIRILGEKWKPIVGINLKVRIGINTGKVIVGDLGSRRRIEYTVIGSAVNLAQRMESLATPGGILLTEYTRSSLEAEYARRGKPNPFSFSDKRSLTAKGYDNNVFAYEVIIN